MMIASCIATVFHKDFIIGPFLSFASGHITFTLLSDNIGNPGFFSFEIIADSLRIIRSIPFLEDRFTFLHSGRIFNTVCMNRTAVKIHRDNLRS